MVGPQDIGGGMGLPYHVIYPMLHVMYLPPPPLVRTVQTPVKTIPSATSFGAGNEHYKLLPWNSFFASYAYADFTREQGLTVHVLR